MLSAGSARTPSHVGPTRGKRPVPARVLLLSVGALSIPVVATTLLPGWIETEGALLMWLPAIVPAFLLTFYRGWHGASVSLALAMATLALTQALVVEYVQALDLFDEQLQRSGSRPVELSVAIH